MSVNRTTQAVTDTIMTTPYESTKELLLVTAGKLFATYGYDGVSTRMITDEAGLKLSSIHYHYGSKENLYIEAFRYAKNKGVRTSFTDVAEENPALMQTPEGQAEIIRNTIFRRFHDYFRPDRPRWEIEILMQEIIKPSAAFDMVSEKLFKPELEGAELFLRRIKPDSSDIEISVWGDQFHAQLMFYSMVREPMKKVRPEIPFDAVYIQAISRNLARALILTLGLPLPQDLR